jgi:putative hydrolase of the HAD superfamily
VQYPCRSPPFLINPYFTLDTLMQGKNNYNNGEISGERYGRMPFEIIAFDADDTLWHSESFYQAAQDALAVLLAPYDVDRQTIHDALLYIEIANLPTFGYGAKAFTISMIETAIKVTGGKVSTEEIETIIGLGKSMLTHDVHLLDHSRETVARLAQSHPLMIITKGDLIDQERKLAASGLAGYFRHVEIVSDKKPEIYSAVMQKHGIAPARFLMVGNSMRSDVLPVLDLGGWAVHVPYHVTWVHETGTLPEPIQERFFEIDHLGQLTELVSKLESEIL